jgi:FtsP/CotA-like multicopper oxidase with cupredoxin domain
MHAGTRQTLPSATDAHRLTAQRKLYFAEARNGTNGPTKFFLTIDGQTPAPFNPTAAPAVTTKVGSVEDWTVSNHTGEAHAFHMHHLHFMVLQENGRNLATPEVRDTVIVPAWRGSGPYPAVKLRMDFRDPRMTGVFEFQCENPHHAEAGMMGRIRVLGVTATD